MRLNPPDLETIKMRLLCYQPPVGKLVLKLKLKLSCLGSYFDPYFRKPVVEVFGIIFSKHTTGYVRVRCPIQMHVLCLARSCRARTL